MTLDDVNGIKKYAESVLASPMNADRYIQRARTEVLQQERLYNIDLAKDCKTVSAVCEGSSPEDKYKLQIDLQHDEPSVSCTCPAKEREALCKHSLGLLLWRAGHLAEERLRKLTQASEPPKQHESAVSTPTGQQAQQGAGEGRVAEEATIAYQAADAPSVPPVARPAASVGKRRLPSSFAARPEQPAAKKGRAKKEAAPKEGAVLSSSPVQTKSKGQVQSKLSFQSPQKKAKPAAEAGAAEQEAAAAKHAPHPPLVRRQRPILPAPAVAKPTRCNAQDMLDTSDEDLLQLCRSAVEASEGQAVQGHATQPSQPLQPPPAEDALSAPPAAMPDPDPAPEHAAAASMPAQHLEPAEGAIVVNTQRSRGEGGEPAEMHAGAGGASSGVAVQTQAAAEEAAASASAAQEPSLPAQPPQGKSMLEELLGDAFHLLHAGGSSQPCASEQPGRPDEHVGSGRPPDLAETAAPAHVEAAQHVPELHVPLYEIGSHTSTQRTGLQPAGKKLSLRERMQLMKECD